MAFYYEGEDIYHRYDNCPRAVQSKKAGKEKKPLASPNGKVICKDTENSDTEIVGVDLKKEPRKNLSLCPDCDEMSKQ